MDIEGEDYSCLSDVVKLKHMNESVPLYLSFEFNRGGDQLRHADMLRRLHNAGYHHWKWVDQTLHTNSGPFGEDAWDSLSNSHNWFPLDRGSTSRMTDEVLLNFYMNERKVGRFYDFHAKHAEG